HGEVITAAGTTVERRPRSPNPGIRAARIARSGGPADAFQIGAASRVVWKPSTELSDRLRVISHPALLPVVVRGIKLIAPLLFWQHEQSGGCGQCRPGWGRSE